MPNSANPASGTLQAPLIGGMPHFVLGTDCEQQKKPRPPPEKKKSRAKQYGKGWTDCDEKQLCAKVKSLNKMRSKNQLVKQPAGASSSPDYSAAKTKYIAVFTNVAQNPTNIMSEAFLDDAFFDPCAKDEWEKDGRDPCPTVQTEKGIAGSEKFNADHVHDCGLGGNLKSITNFKMFSASVNKSIGPALSQYAPSEHGRIVIPGCNCS